MDRHRRQQAGDGLVTNQQRDHREHDRARKAGQIAELAGAEHEARIARVPARVRVRERGDQHRARVRRHVEPVRDERERAEQRPADDLRHHHRRTQRDHHPRPALVSLVRCAEKDVVVSRAERGIPEIVHPAPDHLK